MLRLDDDVALADEQVASPDVPIFRRFLRCLDWSPKYIVWIVNLNKKSTRSSATTKKKNVIVVPKGNTLGYIFSLQHSSGSSPNEVNAMAVVTKSRISSAATITHMTTSDLGGVSIGISFFPMHKLSP
jgi:hypothetical protein